MNRQSRQMRLCAGVALTCIILATGTGRSESAEVSEASLKAMQAQIEQLTRTVKRLEAAQAHSNANALAAKKQADQARVVATEANAKAIVTKT